MARDFTTIGVVGLGTMGAGIAEVFARNGLARRRRRDRPTTALERGRQHLEHSTDRAVDARQARPRTSSAELLGRITLHHRRWTTSPTPTSWSRRSSERLELKQADLRASSTRSCAPGRRSSPPTPPRCRSPRSRPPTSQPGRVIGMHFFNPAPVQKLVEVIRTVVTEPDVRRRRRRRWPSGSARTPSSCGDKAGFIANALLFGYLNHAVVDVRGPLRHPRGHRRRDAVRLRLPDGPAGAARPDRPRHGVRDPRHDVPAGPRPAARARRRSSSRWSPPGLLGRKTGRGFYTYEAADSPVVVDDDADPVAPTTSRSCATTSRASAWSAPARWPPASSRSSPRPGTTCSYVGRSAGQGRRRAARPSRRSLDKADPARQARGGRRATRRSAGVTGTTSLDDLADVDLVVEAIAEDLAVKTALFENLDEICKPGAILATTTSSLPVIELRQGDQRGRRTSSACTSSTRRRS